MAKKDEETLLSEDLALKHRPQILEDMVGQEEAVKQIKGMFKSKRLKRAFLVYGEFGSGKTTIGRLIAKYVNCENFDYDEISPCGECFSCKSFTADGIKGQPDIHEWNMADKTGIDNIRALKSQSRYKPRGKYRVYILDEVHAISKAAQGAILKPLEEPPANTIFILVTTDPQMLLETIRSRCRRVEIKHIKPGDVLKLLKKVGKKEGYLKKIDKKALKKVAALTDCHPRDALKTLDSLFDIIDQGGDDINVEEIVQQVTGAPPWQLVTKFLFSIYRGSYTGAFKAIEDVQNHEYFMKDVLRYHRFAMYNIIAPNSYYEKTYYFFNKALQELIDDNKIKTNDAMKMAMADTMTAFVETASEIKKYLVDSKCLTVACATKIIPEFKAIKPKKKK